VIPSEIACTPARSKPKACMRRARRCASVQTRARPERLTPTDRCKACKTAQTRPLQCLPQGTLREKYGFLAGSGGQTPKTLARRSRNTPPTSQSTSIQSVHACSPNRRIHDTLPSQDNQEHPKEGECVHTPRNRVHACTLCMLPRKRSTREHKTSINDDGSDGVDRVAPTQDLSLKRPESASPVFDLRLALPF
jgi:hypothetical protein